MSTLSVLLNTMGGYLFGGLIPEQASLLIFGVGLFAATGGLRSILNKRERSGADLVDSMVKAVVVKAT